MDIDLPRSSRKSGRVDRYEKALIANDLAVLDTIFRDAPPTIRYGVGENLYGYGGSRSSAERARRSG